jgi:hypothetical protein
MFGLPLTDATKLPAMCRYCKKAIDVSQRVRHAFTCKHEGPQQYATRGRHDSITQATARAWRAAVAAGALEPSTITQESRIIPNTTKMHRDDVTVERQHAGNGDAAKLHIDVTVRHGDHSSLSHHWPPKTMTAGLQAEHRLAELEALVALENNNKQPALDLGDCSNDYNEAVHEEVQELAQRLGHLPAAHERLTADGINGYMQMLGTKVYKGALAIGYREKNNKYKNTLKITSGVRPLVLTNWGLEHGAVSSALPFKAMIKFANGDPEVKKQAAQMKDQWRRRASLALVRENGYVVMATETGINNRKFILGHGRNAACSWADLED